METTLPFVRANAALLAEKAQTEFNAKRWRHYFVQGENGLPDEQPSVSAARTILVPLTLSNYSYAVLEAARELARESSARLVLLHVVQLNIAGEERGIPRGRLFDELCQNAKTQLQELANEVGSRATVEVLVCVGRPADAIVETARDLMADAIVMHVNSHRGWIKWLHRNTALTVVRHAPCRVWLVGPGNHGERTGRVAPASEANEGEVIVR